MRGGSGVWIGKPRETQLAGSASRHKPRELTSIRLGGYSATEVEGSHPRALGRDSAAAAQYPTNDHDILREPPI